MFVQNAFIKDTFIPKFVGFLLYLCSVIIREDFFKVILCLLTVAKTEHL